MLNDDETQKVSIKLVDQENKPIGTLTISAEFPSFMSKKWKDEDYKEKSTPKMSFHHVPSVQKIDNETPILFNASKEVEHLPRLMLIEETQYQVVFEPDSSMKQIDSIDLMPILERNNGKTLTFEPWRVSQNNSLVGGNLNFHSYVGKSFFDVIVNGKQSSKHPFEVRSKKIGYLKQYPAMIGDLSLAASGILFERGAPLYQTYDFSTRTRNTLFQDFMFLEYLFSAENLPQSFEQVKRNVYNMLITKKESLPSAFSYGIGSSELINIASSPGNLLLTSTPPKNWPASMRNYVPDQINQEIFEETIDTPENRVLKDLLLSLSYLISQLKNTINEGDKEAMGYIYDRLAEYDTVLQEYLSEDWLNTIGILDNIPSNSQVLQKKEGYREIFKYYLNFEFAFRLQWDEVENYVKGYNKRLSELYEYWCYIKLINVLNEITNERKSIEDIFDFEDNKWSIQVKRGQKSALQYTFIKDGVRSQITLMYNRLFSQHTRNRSYSLPFKPDYSMLIQIEDKTFFIHFDAKYRSEGEILEFYNNIGKSYPIDSEINEVETEQINTEEGKIADEISKEEQERRTYKAGDVYKMHTYKDAILKTEGAYIFYPGDKHKIFRVNKDEEIPSVGAFTLTPGKEGVEDVELKRFIEAVLSKFVR